MENNRNKKRIAIVHDHLGWQGGGERTALIMAIGLKADFITAYANADTFSEHQKELDGRLFTLTDKIVNVRGIRFFWMRYLYFKNRRIFKNYDILIASGQSAMEAVAFYSRPDARKILYNHTQPRRVYDLYEISKKSYPFYLRPLYALFAFFWKRLYLAAISRIDVNIANSENVRQRAIKYVGKDVDHVVWPPILTDRFCWLADGDYFLSFARLDEAKRVETIVEAFRQMPNQKLIIASGGPRLELVRKMAAGADNIEVKGWVDDQELFGLVGRCRAAIYIPIDEDAGMTPLEANAAGKPVLGVREGGLLETIKDNETGILIKASPNAEDLIEAAATMTPAWCQARRNVCEQNARAYSRENFISKIKAIIEK